MIRYHLPDHSSALYSAFLVFSNSSRIVTVLPPDAPDAVPGWGVSAECTDSDVTEAAPDSDPCDAVPDRGTPEAVPDCDV
jgi:hypothetical protein